MRKSKRSLVLVDYKGCLLTFLVGSDIGAKLFLRNALLLNHYNECGEVMHHAARFPQH